MAGGLKKKKKKDTEWNPSKHLKQTALGLLVKTVRSSKESRMLPDLQPQK